MFTSIIDKVLAALLGIALFAGAGAIWYADHEHARIAPLQQQVAAAAVVASQAIADREEAQQAASAAQAQLAAAQRAVAVQAASAASAASDAHAARSALAALSAKQPTIKQTLDAPLPKEVWDAVYNTGK